MKCTNCGYNDENDQLNFCPKCGTRFIKQKEDLDSNDLAFVGEPACQFRESLDNVSGKESNKTNVSKQKSMDNPPVKGNHNVFSRRNMFVNVFLLFNLFVYLMVFLISLSWIGGKVETGSLFVDGIMPSLFCIVGLLLMVIMNKKIGLWTVFAAPTFLLIWGIEKYIHLRYCNYGGILYSSHAITHSASFFFECFLLIFVYIIPSVVIYLVMKIRKNGVSAMTLLSSGGSDCKKLIILLVFIVVMTSLTFVIFEPFFNH